MEEAFTKVVEHIFNNWTALKLAVEHSMGGPNSRQVALECMNYVAQFCLQNNNLQVEEIEEALEDIMDEEFGTICEDDSIKEISILLIRFLTLMREGNTAQCEIEFNNLPASQEGWLVNSKPQQQLPAPGVQDSSDDDEEEEEEEQPVESSSSSSNNNNQTEPMEEDPGWTQVKTRRKR